MAIRVCRLNHPSVCGLLTSLDVCSGGGGGVCEESAVCRLNHPSVCGLLTSLLTRRKFHAESFFPRATSLWNKLPGDCFPYEYNLKLFKSKVNKHLSSLAVL
ncbi:hypothetical protein Bbelb_221300 [Branchiostoma belcheri]|nr:hypothetical protein Bbelb_221300 [Branchiostoma belcheri]